MESNQNTILNKGRSFPIKKLFIIGLLMVVTVLIALLLTIYKTPSQKKSAAEKYIEAKYGQDFTVEAYVPAGNTLFGGNTYDNFITTDTDGNSFQIRGDEYNPGKIYELRDDYSSRLAEKEILPTIEASSEKFFSKESVALVNVSSVFSEYRINGEFDIRDYFSKIGPWNYTVIVIVLPESQKLDNNQEVTRIKHFIESIWEAGYKPEGLIVNVYFANPEGMKATSKAKENEKSPNLYTASGFSNVYVQTSIDDFNKGVPADIDKQISNGFVINNSKRK